MRVERSIRARFASAVLSIILVVGLTGSTVAWEPNTFSSAAEDGLAALISIEHQRLCESSLFRAYQLNKISRWRSKDMAVRDYFSHTILGTDKQIFDYFSSYGIRDWITGGEILVWNNFSSEVSLETAYDQFMGSEDHRGIIQSCAYNAFGVGAYRASDGRMIYAVVFLKQPIRRVIVSSLDLRTGAGASYEFKTRLSYGNLIMVFSQKDDKHGDRWYYGHTAKGWGWVVGRRTK